MKTRISVYDRGFLYGDGLFETMRCYSGKVFKLDEHLSRLIRSARILSIKIPYSKAALERLIRRAIKLKHLKSAYVRLTVTRGEGAFNFKVKNCPEPNVVIIVKRYVALPCEFYTGGIRAKISGIRQNEYSPLAGIKSLSFLNHILARIDAQDSGFDEAILMNTKGDVAEAATSNIFLVKRGALITPSPDSGILPGITRGVVIQIAAKLGIKVTARPVAPKEVTRADEVFLTNSSAEILPVVKVDRSKIGGGVPGEITKLLHAHYRKMI
ncbi:MAG: aminotransferase class IV [Candidatus Omnitrophota bacterium]|nr:aminotransferase class IV [Candidatus Omnitrophota bacterium]